jgi:hypothetical protein
MFLMNINTSSLDMYGIPSSCAGTANSDIHGAHAFGGQEKLRRGMLN